MEEQQVDADFIGRVELYLERLEHITEEVYVEYPKELKRNPALLEGLRRIYAARFALRDSIDQHKARAAA